jgi:hypothetical protein
MFSKAYAIASQYTRPVMVLKRLENGNVASGFATYMLLNKDGWALTAAHVMTDAVTAQQHAQERAAYMQRMAEINSNPSYSTGKKRHEINDLKKNYEWITNISFWWGHDGITFGITHFDTLLDVAVVKLDNIAVLGVATYPTLASVNQHISPGTSLCRLGFPFHTATAKFDSSVNQFRVDSMPQLSMFPNEGIHTRIMMIADQPSGRQVKFIETSNPGLRGQSGGPIFDAEGRVWGMQSRTLSIPLGFAPTIKEGRKEITEHQFIHIGVGTHVEEIRKFLESKNIAFQVAA